MDNLAYSKNLFTILIGEDIKNIPEDKNNFLIDGILRQRDYILLIAEEKIGKTILAQQMCCSLSSGTPFLGVYDVLKPSKVWYISTEGRKEDLQDRFVRMSEKIPTNFDNICFISTLFRFNTDDGVKEIDKITELLEDHIPDLVIIDALYMAVEGSLKDDNVINDINFTLAQLSDKLQCAIMVVHHMKKASKDKEGNEFSRTDRDSFGSAFLAANVDHIFWLDKWIRDKDCKLDRVLRCNTQRSGHIVDGIRIRLHQPTPLYFGIVSKTTEYKNKIVNLLHTNKNGFNVGDIEFRTRINRNMVYQSLRELVDDKIVEKHGAKVKYYRMINEHGKYE